LSVSRQERPASTRMLEAEFENTVQLPRLPLPRTVILTATEMQHNRVERSREEQNAKPAR